MAIITVISRNFKLQRVHCS